MDKTFYPNFKDHWDDDIFRAKTLMYINKDTVFLDAGAGRGFLPQMNFKGLVKKAIGVDPSIDVKNNPFLDESFVGFCDDMPFLESDFIDVAVSNNVLEHISDPNTFLSEINRVLKVGGLYIVKTPNIYHYIVLLSRITPDRFHIFYNKLRGRTSVDTFPTLYKINSKRDLFKYAHENGFSVLEYQAFEARPEYLRIFIPLYIIGLIYERFVNFFNLSQIKIIYYAVLKKENSLT